MAAADNNYDKELAKTIAPEDMTNEKILMIVKPSFERPDKKLSDPDYEAVCRRIALMAFCKTTENRLVCYVSVPTSPTTRQLSWFVIPEGHKHTLKAEVQGAQKTATRLQGWCPDSHWENCVKEWHLVNLVRFGQVPNQEVQASFPEVWRHALWPEDFPAPAIAPAQPMNEPWDLPRPVIVGDEMVVGDLTDHVDALGRECDEKLQQIKGLDKQIRQQEDRLLKMGDYIEGAEQENVELMKEKA